MVYYGQDYMLEDMTGDLYGGAFDDIHGRIRLTVHCTQEQSCNVTYMIYDRTRSPTLNYNSILAALDFGPKHALGTVSIKSGAHIPMKQYLSKVGGVFGK